MALTPSLGPDSQVQLKVSPWSTGTGTPWALLGAQDSAILASSRYSG